MSNTNEQSRFPTDRWSDAPAGAASAASSAAEEPFRPVRLQRRGFSFQFALQGDFARNMEYCWRVLITLIFSISLAVYPPTAKQFIAPFLVPILALLGCASSIGASVNVGWQMTKGTFYAALFGFICARCGVGYESRIATTLLLFAFSFWARYFIAQDQLTTMKLAAGLNATILLASVNDPVSYAYPWQLLATVFYASVIGFIGCVLPFPKPALNEIEDRWQHGLRQSAHLFDLIVEAFTCGNAEEVKVRMLSVRIQQTLEYLVTNRDKMKTRMREAEHEFPIIAFRFLFGTYNNYTYKRFQQHFVIFQQLSRHLRCMEFSLQSLPYDAFHQACLRAIKPELEEVALGFREWINAIASTDSMVKRTEQLEPALQRYSRRITGLFEAYSRFRADMYFEGKLYLIDGGKTLLRKRRNKSKARLDHFDPTAEPHPRNNQLAYANSDELKQTEAVWHSGGGDSSNGKNARTHAHVNFRLETEDDDDDETAASSQDESAETSASSKNPFEASLVNKPQQQAQLMPNLPRDPSATSAAASQPANEPHLPLPAAPAHRRSPSFSKSFNHAPPTSAPHPDDFSWTSEDVISLNFFMFQLNEFLRRSLKFRREVVEDDATTHTTTLRDIYARYHLNHPSQLPWFIWTAIVTYAKTLFGELRQSCRWDRRRFIEAIKFAIALELAAVNELIPTTWTPIYQRTHHGWWAAVTVAFTMSSSLGGHFTTMVLRVLGTFVGAIVGYLTAQICHENAVGLVAALSIFGAATTYMRNDVYSGYAHLITGITAIVVAIGSQVYSVSEFAFVRIQETLIGVIIGMVIHNVFLPDHATTLLHREVVANTETITKVFEHSFGKYEVRAAATTQFNNGNFSALHPISSPLSPMPVHPDKSPSPSFDMLNSNADGVKLVHMAAPFAPNSVYGSAENPSVLATSNAPSLDPSHEFAKLGPKLFASLDTQTSLVFSSTQEPTLWRARFPERAYHRLIGNQRTISLYLYCMDLSLQRMIQSGSIYLMPDVEHHFTRLRVKVVESLEQIREGLLAYTNKHEHSSNPLTGVVVAKPNGANHNLPLPTLQRQYSSKTSDLVGLATSLAELEVRYKQWIDQRILEKRNQIRVAEELLDEHSQMRAQTEQEHEPQVEPTPAVEHPQPPSTAPSEAHSLQSVVSSSQVYSAFGGILHPIPLDTPHHQTRMLQQLVKQKQLETDALELPPALLDARERPQQQQPAAIASATASAAASAANASRRVKRRRSVMSNMEKTLTRSMDVLALNTFLFATRGLIREILLFSQAVRILLHLRDPGRYEQSF